MNAFMLKLKNEEHKSKKGITLQPKPVDIILVLLVLWLVIPYLLHKTDPTTGYVDQSIWLLIVLGLLSFMSIAVLSWWLLRWFLIRTDLPAIDTILSQFKNLEPWQQLGFYWASYVLLLLAASCCLIAIC